MKVDKGLALTAIISQPLSISSSFLKSSFIQKSEAREPTTESPLEENQ